MIPSALRAVISKRLPKLKEARICVGLDGFVDTIVRVVRSKHAATTYFKTIAEFGEFTRDRSGLNFSLELEERFTKSGGNAPIMGHAMARLGASVHVIGALGYPDLHPEFQSMASEMTLTSYANPGLSTAMEFDDGKILLAQMSSLNHSDWITLRDRVGIAALREQVNNSDLNALVNWSELDHATSMWKGILNDIVQKDRPGSRPIGLFDLSDCTRRDPTAILEVLDLLSQFNKYWSVVLSVNKNEATILCKALMHQSGSAWDQPLDQMGEYLFKSLNIDCLVIHHAKEALGWNQAGHTVVANELVDRPVISTGAGDNFNAGLASGLLMQLGLADCLILGHAVAASYMKSGTSGSLEDL
jgi:sugar/nucleoside kinase (ribokinase family)